MSSLPASVAATAPVPLEALSDRVRDHLAASRSASTRRAYAADWRDFAAWCQGARLEALPAAPETVALYLSALADADAKASTIARRVTAIGRAHAAAGLETPTRHELVCGVQRGIRRTIGVAPSQKAPALTADVRAMVEALPADLAGTRDRALLLVGFAGAFRRAELVSLDVADLAETGDGLVVTIRSSKTDQESAGRKVGLPYGSDPMTCPVRAVRAWRAAADIEAGPLFRSVDRHGHVGTGRLSSKSVALIVKRAAARVGLDPERYGGHSLRAGFATAAAAAGCSERSIAAQTGHRSMAVLRGYIREGSLFRDNAAMRLGL